MIAKTAKVVGAGSKELVAEFSGQSMGLLLSSGLGSERAAHRDQHLLVFDWVFEPQEAVHFSDAGEPSAQGGGRGFDRIMRDKRGDSFRGSGQRAASGMSAPLFENREISPIASQGIFGVSTFEARDC
jgi:hypothetical protein